MKKKTEKLIYGFRFNSVFVRTFILIVILVVVLTSIFLYHSVKVATENLQDKAYSSRINMLINTSNAMEITFESLSQLMRQTIHNSNCISAMIVPNKNEYERTNNITNQFYEITSGYPIVKKLLLYIHTDNTVYSSDRSLLPTKESPDLHLIDAICDPDMSETVLNDSLSYSTKIRLVGERMILYQNLYSDYQKQIGTLIFEIDTNYLYDTFLSDSSNDYNITYVINSSGSKVFTQADTLTLTPETYDLIRHSGETSGHISITNNDNEDIICFYYVSPLTNWLYLNPIKSTEMQTRILYIQEVFFIFITLLIGFIISVYIAYRIYLPIWELVDSIMRQEGRGYIDSYKGQVKDELGLLELAYTKSNLKNEQLKKSLEHMTPVALDRLLTNIILERETSEERIMETLQSFGNPIPFEAHYTVLIIAIENEIEDLVPEYDMNIFLIRIQNLISSILEDEIYCTSLRITDQSITAVIVFPLEMSLSNVKHEIANAYDKISSDLSNIPYRKIIGISSVCKSITDIRYCYLEAQENLNHKCFYEESENGEFEASSIMNECADYVKRIMIYFYQGNMKHATMLSKQVCTYIAKLGNIEEVARGYRILLDMAIEKLIALKLVSTEDVFAEKSEMDKNFKNYTDINEFEKCTNLFFTKIALNIEERNKTKKYQKILNVREYINENNSKCDMSLAMVADHVGISPTYLSRLFKEEIGMSFVDYLNQIRIEKAKQLLINTDISIKDIGYQSGFNSMQNFFRVFKKFTATTPGIYRRSINDK